MALRRIDTLQLSVKHYGAMFLAKSFPYFSVCILSKFVHFIPMYPFFAFMEENLFQNIYNYIFCENKHLLSSGRLFSPIFAA